MRGVSVFCWRAVVAVVMLSLACHAEAQRKVSWGNYLVSQELYLRGNDELQFGRGLASLESVPTAPGCHLAVGAYALADVFFHANGTMGELKTLEPENSTGFGAVAPLTDLNGDGRLEIAVTTNVDGYGKSVHIGSQADDFFFNTTSFKTFAMDELPLSRFPVFQQRYNASSPRAPDFSFGVSITFVGDIDNNGVGDIAITGDHRVHSNSGSAVHILFLDESLDVLNVSTITLVPDDSDSAPSFASPDELGFQVGLFGTSIIGLGDLDGDNTPDMAATARTNMIGYLFILFLTPDGGVKDYRVHTSDAAYRPSGALDFGWFGASIKSMGNEAALTEEERFSSADFNNDHFPDLVLYEDGEGDVWLLFLDSTGNITGNMYYGISSSFIAMASAVFDANDDSIPDVAIANMAGGSIAVLLMDGIRITVTSATFEETGEEEQGNSGLQQTLELTVTFEVKLSAKPEFGIEVEFEVETNLAEEDVVVLSSSPLKFEPGQDSATVQLSAVVPAELFDQARGKRKQEEDPTVTLVLKSAMNALVNNSNPSFTLALIKPGDESSEDKEGDDEDQTKVIVPIVVSVVVVLLAFLVAIGIGVWWRRRRIQKIADAKLMEMESQYGTLEAGGDRNDESEDEEEEEEEEIEMEVRDHWEISYDELKFIRKIGEGASGEVWKGMWRNSPVAIKKLHTMDEEQLQDFQTEAQTLKAVRPHGNVIRLLGIMTEEDKPFCIVTEFMHQGDLNSYLLNNKTKIDHDIMLKWAIDIASGMHHLHSEGITHRDLATRNLLLTKRLRIKVADFGMSRQMEKIGGIQKTTKEVGPLKWMAPEAIEDHVYSEKSDVWSFGVCLWEIASFGAVPYDGLSPVNAAIRVCQQKASLLVPPEDMPPILRTVMLSCWAFSPAERPTFADILQSLTAG